MKSYQYSNELRNYYLRYFLNTLVDEYYVRIKGISDLSGIHQSSLSDFRHSRRNFGDKYLDMLEDALIGHYGGLMADIVPQDSYEFYQFLESKPTREPVEY